MFPSCRNQSILYGANNYLLNFLIVSIFEPKIIFKLFISFTYKNQASLWWLHHYKLLSSFVYDICVSLATMNSFVSWKWLLFQTFTIFKLLKSFLKWWLNFWLYSFVMQKCVDLFIFPCYERVRGWVKQSLNNLDKLFCAIAVFIKLNKRIVENSA